MHHLRYPKPSHGVREQPMKRTDKPETSVKPAAVNLPAASSAAGERRVGQALVIDANALSLIAVAGVLDSEGYQCVCAKSLDSALTATKMSKFDLVVCDVGSDAQAALELLVGLRAAEDQADLPAILLADGNGRGWKRRPNCLAAPTRCLFKPIDVGVLLAVAHQLLMAGISPVGRPRGARSGRPGWISL